MEPKYKIPWYYYKNFILLLNKLVNVKVFFKVNPKSSTMDVIKLFK